MNTNNSKNTTPKSLPDNPVREINPQILRLKERLYVPPEVLKSIPRYPALHLRQPESDNELIQRRAKAFLRIPKGIATVLYSKYPQNFTDKKKNAAALRKTKKLERAVSLVIDLRVLYREPLFMNIKKRYLELSEYFNVTEKTVKAWIKEAINLRLAKMEGENLRLLSSRELLYYFNVTNNTNREWKIHKYTLPHSGNVKQILQICALAENLSKQDYRVNEKIILQLAIENKYIRPNYSCNADTFKWLKKVLRYDKLKKVYLKQFQERYVHSLSSKSDNSINPVCTLSCKGTARVLNRRARSSGHRMQQTLKQTGLLSVKRDYIKTDSQTAKHQYAISFVQMHVYGETPFRTDVFKYSYPMKVKEVRRRIRLARSPGELPRLDGMEEKYYINLPNRLQTHV